MRNILRMASKVQGSGARSIASLALLPAALAALTHVVCAAEFSVRDPHLLLSGLVQTYDGTAKPVTVTTVPSELPVSVSYDGSPNAPANAGSYTVLARIDLPFIH